MTHITLVESRINDGPTHVDFELFDRKGRRFGARINTARTVFRDVTADEREAGMREVSWYTIPAGDYFEVTVQAVKNGISWGSSQPRQYFATLAERDAYIARRLVDMRKRFETAHS